MKNQKLFRQLQSLTTEQRNRRTMGIDLASVNDTLRLINAEDRKIAAIVGREIPFIAKAVAHVVQSFKTGGRLFYVGAGTSGRLGILDASECPPTFGSNPSMVQGLIAGGRKAVFQSQEGSEDLEKEGAREIRRKKITSKDTVCGIAASMRTPYVIGALAEAKKRGAHTIVTKLNFG
jgi:N-acetylmuramic acid 6-phosphate etherase